MIGRMHTSVHVSPKFLLEFSFHLVLCCCFCCFCSGCCFCLCCYSCFCWCCWGSLGLVITHYVVKPKFTFLILCCMWT